MALDMTPDEIAAIVRQTVEKTLAEAPANFTQHATVVGIDNTAGVVPYITVLPDGPGDTAVVATSEIGGLFAIGQRVFIWWTPPAGCVIIGSPETATVPYVRASRGCTEGGGGG